MTSGWPVLIVRWVSIFAKPRSSYGRDFSLFSISVVVILPDL